MPGTVLKVTIASIAPVNAHNKVGAIVSPILDLEKLRLRKRERLDGLRVARGRFKPRAEDLRDVERSPCPSRLRAARTSLRAGDAALAHLLRGALCTPRAGPQWTF